MADFITSGGGGKLDLIQTQSLSGATGVSFTSLAGYTHYILVVKCSKACPTTGGNWGLRFNADTSNNYVYQALIGAGA